MDIQQIKEKVQQNLSEKRYLHTIRVSQLAKQLAERFGVDVIRVEKAALIHDYLKETPNEQLQHYLVSANDPSQVLNAHPILWHGPAAAEIATDAFGIADQSIIDAIRYHTTGRAHMNEVEEIVFIADYMEPSRSFPGIDKVRNAAEHSIKKSIAYALGNTITYLIGQRGEIHPLTFEAYNDYVEHIQEKK